MSYTGAKRGSTPERPSAPRRGSAGGKIVRLLLAPFFFVFRTVFTFVLLSVIAFLVFYFKMHGTPEKEQQYDKIMAAMEEVPSVLGGLAQQAGLSELAKSMGYEPKPEDAEHSREMLKNLCAQLDAVENADPLPWKNGEAPVPAPREDETAPSAPAGSAPAPDAAVPVEPTVPAPAPNAGGLPPDAVPTELEPIIAALKNAKNLSTIQERLSVKFVGQHGEGAVLFLDKLLTKNQGLLRLAALESLRRINTPEALSVLHKHTQAHLPVASPAEAPANAVPAPAEPASPPAPEAPPSPQAAEPVQW